MRSFKRFIAGTILAATASLGVVSPVLEAKATPSPGEDWAYVTNSENCVPQFSVSDNVVDGTIVVQVVQGNTCPVSNSIFLFIQDDGRPQPLRIPGTRENILSSTWVFHPGDARPGRYRVIGIAPTPSGIGDYNYVSSRDLGIDQVITVGGNQGQEQSAPTPPPVVTLPIPRQQESRSEPSQAQGTGQKTLLDVAWCLYGKLGHIIWNGWKTDFSSLEVCFFR